MTGDLARDRRKVREAKVIEAFKQRVEESVISTILGENATASDYEQYQQRQANKEKRRERHARRETGRGMVDPGNIRAPYNKGLRAKSAPPLVASARPAICCEKVGLPFRGQGRVSCRAL